ncbi:MAG: hypothetical protein PHP54_02280 [Clostridia bacterium]|nr:hypothetical protein [Clostridia bacterium]
MNKKGISLMSMVIYVVLFFAFSAFAVGMSLNMNYKNISQKGKVWIHEQAQKLQYNLLNSAKDSTTIDHISGKIVFSNNDEYDYDEEKKVIYKNGGILVTDVEELKSIVIDNLTGVNPTFSTAIIDRNKDYSCLSVKFKKYGEEFSTQIFVTAGDVI